MSNQTDKELSEVLNVLSRTATLALQPHEREALHDAARRLLEPGDRMEGWAMPHWDGMIFSRLKFEDGLGRPAILTIKEPPDFAGGDDDWHGGEPISGVTDYE